MVVWREECVRTTLRDDKGGIPAGVRGGCCEDLKDSNSSDNGGNLSRY